MKRILCLLLCLAMLPIMLPAPASAETETTVRVRLSTADATTVSVKLTGQYAVGDTALNGGTVTASISSGKITVSHSKEGKLKTSSSSVRLTRVGTDASTVFTYENPKHGKRVYYGDLVFYNDGGTLRMINYVDMKHYLYGVVSGEMSDSYQADILKTEAICAKCYALAEVESRTSKYFDVYDTTISQLYFGYVASDRNTIAAVDAVWKQTLRFEGKTVKTYYSTANGGQVITPRICWGGAQNDGAYWFGYDPFDLMSSSKNVILPINGASPKSMNASLYAFLLEKTGAKEIVSIEALTGVFDPNNPNGTARYPSALAPSKHFDWKLTVKDSAGKQKAVSFSCTADELKTAAAPDAAGVVCFAVRTDVRAWKLIWGVNSGHRAGLSHRGAIQMVKQGYTYVDVLKFYYRGSTLYDENGKAIVSNASFDFTYTGPDPVSPTAAPTVTPSASAAPTATPTTPIPSAPGRKPSPKWRRTRSENGRSCPEQGF